MYLFVDNFATTTIKKKKKEKEKKILLITHVEFKKLTKKKKYRKTFNVSDGKKR